MVIHLDFKTIFYKNLQYNLNKYISYIFVNIFVVSVLFMYSTLLFNDALHSQMGMELATNLITYAAYATVIFSIIFVTYTGIYFVKSRGKEFGIYLTLGMTSKDLIKITVFENLIILFISTFLGILTGFLFSKTFYLILGKVLRLSQDIYYVDFMTIFLSIGIFSLIFIFNMFFTGRFIKNLSIIEITKASSLKGISKSRPVVGLISSILVVTTITLIISYKKSSGLIYDFSFLKTIQDVLIPFAIVTILVSIYFSIAFLIDGIIGLISKFPNLYNKNLLILSNLKHKFYSYKVSLYVVALLIGLSVYFMGFGLSTYIFLDENINNYIPYDFMIENPGAEINLSELDQITTLNNGMLSDFSQFKYKQDKNNVASIVPSNKTHYIVTLENLLELGYTESELYDISYITNEEYLSVNPNFIYIPFINSYGDIDFTGAIAEIVTSDIYQNIDSKEISSYLFNINTSNTEEIKNYINEEYPNNTLIVNKSEKFEGAFRTAGLVFFSVLFLSILFIIASSVVLYYKIISDIEEEKAQLKLFSKIGLTKSECRSYLNKHLGVIFFTPLIIGGSLGLFFTYASFTFNLTVNLILFPVFALINILLFASLRRKFFKELNL